MTAAILIGLALVIFELAGIHGAIRQHTREVRAIAEQEAEERRVERQHLANVSARWQG